MSTPEQLAAAVRKEAENIGGILSLQPTPFQLEQASNFLMTTVPRALDSLLTACEETRRGRDAYVENAAADARLAALAPKPDVPRALTEDEWIDAKAETRAALGSESE